MSALHDVNLKIFGVDGHPTELTFQQVCLRGLIIFIIGLIVVRVGDRRSLSQKTGFDALFIVLLGSILSRAINGSAPLWLTIGSSLALMVIHRICAFAAFRSHSFGKMIKGKEVPLVHDGKVNWKAMARSLVSKHDLEEDMRLSAKTRELGDIEFAQLERSGDISFIKKE